MGTVSDADLLMAGLAVLVLLLLALAVWSGRWYLWVLGYAIAAFAIAIAIFFRDPGRSGERLTDTHVQRSISTGVVDYVLRPETASLVAGSEAAESQSGSGMNGIDSAQVRVAVRQRGALTAPRIRTHVGGNRPATPARPGPEATR